MKTAVLPLSIPPAVGGAPVWIRVGTLLDGVSEKPLKNAHLVYDAKSIRYVGAGSPPASALKPGQAAPDAEFSDFTALPGLIEAHAHLFLEGGPVNNEERQRYLQQPAEGKLAQGRARMERLARLGIAGIRDAGDNCKVGLTLQKEYHSRSSDPWPYIDSPGAAIHHKGRYGSFMAEPIENQASPEECVENRISTGAHRIKLIPTGIINFQKGAVTAAPQMDAAEVGRLVKAAQALGKQTFAHASGADGIENAIEGGVDTIEHGFFITRGQLAKMRDRKIGWVPTFAPVQIQIDRAAEMGWSPEIVGNLQKIIDGHCESIQRAVETGVMVIAGSDAGSCGVPHGLGFITELELMERAGMSPIHVINAATGAASSRLGFGESIGKIAEGFRPRMIFTKFSPLEKISNLRKARTVVFDGQALENSGNDPESGL